MKLKIGDILQDQSGRLHDFHFEQEYNLSEDYSILGPIKVAGQLMRDSEGLIVIITQMDADILLPCEFCDQSLERHITLEKPLSRRFMEAISEEYQGESVEEVFLINMHNHNIDLTELLRQELELRIPFHHACVITNGQCATCGKVIPGLSTPQSTPDREPGTQHPFAQLKDLFKDQQS